MDISLHATLDTLPHIEIRNYDDELDDYRSIINDVCEEIEGKVHITLSGFGQIRWPVSVGTDLPIILEQMPSLIHKIKAGQDVELDLYEQGLERKLRFEPSGDQFVVFCHSYGSWTPSFERERIETKQLLLMLQNFLQTFLSILRFTAPEAALHPWISEWIKGG